MRNSHCFFLFNDIFFRFRFFLPYWEINFMNGIGRTNLHAFAAQFTLDWINIGQVVAHGDSIERTYLEAFRTTYTCHVTILFRHATFFLG